MAPRPLQALPEVAQRREDLQLPPDLTRRLREECADRTGRMFRTRRGLRRSHRNVNRTVEKAAKKAKAQHVSAHSLRHHHGSVLIAAGWPATDVAARLGDDVQTVSQT